MIVLPDPVGDWSSTRRQRRSASQRRGDAILQVTAQEGDHRDTGRTRPQVWRTNWHEACQATVGIDSCLICGMALYRARGRPRRGTGGLGSSPRSQADEIGGS